MKIKWLKLDSEKSAMSRIRLKKTITLRLVWVTYICGGHARWTSNMHLSRAKSVFDGMLVINVFLLSPWTLNNWALFLSMTHGMIDWMVTPLILYAIWQMIDLIFWGILNHPLLWCDLTSLKWNCQTTLSTTSNGLWSCHENWGTFDKLQVTSF